MPQNSLIKVSGARHVSFPDILKLVGDTLKLSQTQAKAEDLGYDGGLKDPRLLRKALATSEPRGEGTHLISLDGAAFRRDGGRSQAEDVRQEGGRVDVGCGQGGQMRGTVCLIGVRRRSHI